MDYLGNLQIVYFTDEEAFRLMDVYNVVEKRSRFFTNQVDSARPSWFDGRYRMNEIEDQVSYLQWGQPAMHEFWEFSLSAA